MKRLGICPGCRERKTIRNDGVCGRCSPRRVNKLGIMTNISKHGYKE